jgi:hypothetical protein
MELTVVGHSLTLTFWFVYSLLVYAPLKSLSLIVFLNHVNVSVIFPL